MAEITRKKRTLVDDLKDFRTGKIGDKYYNNMKNANEYYYKDSGINYKKDPDNPLYGEVTTSSQNNKIKGINSFLNSGNQMVNSVQNDFQYNVYREYENKYKNYNYEQLKTSYKSAKDDREKNWILNKIKKDSSSEELQNWYDTLSQEYDSKLQQNPDPKISKEFEDKASEYEKLIKDKQHQETAQKNQKKDELYSDYYKNYDYEQLKKESENGRLSDYERTWLENAAYEKASSDDLQTSYDNNEETMKEIREQKKNVLDKQNKASSNEEKQSYIREASNLDEQYDSLYSKNETLKNQIEKKKYDEKKKAEYDDVIENNIKAKTIMQKYYNLQKYDEDVLKQPSFHTIQGFENDKSKSKQEAYNYAKSLSKEEREKIINDFNSLENKDTLYKYYKREREEQETVEQNQILTDYSEEHPVLGSLASMGLNTYGSIEDTVKYAGAGIDKAFGGDGYINPDSTNVAKAQVIREKVSEDMDGLGKFFYNTGMSIGDNIARMPLLALPGGEAMSLALAGTSAGVSSANDVINSGGSIESALWTGAAAGTAEVVFEKISLDKLIDLRKQGTESVFRAVVNQMKTEGLEEVGTDIANAITDRIINGDMSQLALQYQNYIAQGYSEEEAKKQIAVDFASQLGQSFAAGAISGGVMSGGTVAINKIGGTIEEKSEKRKSASQLGREALQSEDFNVNELIKTAKKSENPKAVNLANSLEKVVEEKGADKVKAVDVGNLLTLTNSDEITYDYSQDLSELTGTDKQNIIDSNFELNGEEKNTKTSDSEVKYTDTKAFGENYPHGLGAKISKTGERINIVGLKSSARDFNSEDNTVVLLSDNGDLYDADDIRTSVPYYNNLFDYAKNFNTIGARVYLSQYEDYAKRSKSRGKTADIAEYSESFERLYSYGVKGVTYDSIKKSGNFTREINILGAGVAYSAVQSGNNDFKVDTRDKSNKRQKIRMPGESNSISSKVYVDPGSEDSVKVTDEQLAVLQAVAEKTGREIVLTDRMGERTGDENANGGYNPKDGKIYINAEVHDSYMLSVALHEAVHGVAADNPVEYHALCTFITNYLVAKGENIDNLLDDIKVKWGDSVRSEEAALEELVCQTVMAIATDEAAIKTALSLEENKGILKKVASALKKIAKAAYDFIKGVGIQAHNKQAQPWIDNIEALNELAVRLEKAFESTRKLNEQRASAAENTETAQKNNTRPDIDRKDVVFAESGIKFSKINSYPYNMQTVIKEYLNSVNNDIIKFVSEVKNGNQNFQRLAISNVSEKQIKDIKKLLGIDVTGYRNSINTSTVEHILNRHGENGKQDKSMKNIKDIARMSYVLSEYDDVDILRDEKGEPILSIEFMDKNNKPAYMLKYTKKINGTYYVVVAAPENRFKRMWVVSAYIQKNKSTVTQAFDEKSPKTTSETALASPMLSNDSLSHENTKVNGNKNKISSPSSGGSDNSNTMSLPNGTAYNPTLSQNKSSVNNNSMQSNKNNTKHSVDDTIDNEYLEAVKNNDLETAQKLVEEAAKKAGYDSPLLYHGTKSFGFTEFALDKMDDGRSIFLTDSKEIASTYSGVEDLRKISERINIDVDKLTSHKTVELLNKYSEKYNYKYYSESEVEKLKSDNNSRYGRRLNRDNISGDIIVCQNKKTPVFYLSSIDSSKELLKEYVGKGNYSLYAKLNNPYVVECDGSYYNDITYYEDLPDELKKFYPGGLWRTGTTRDVAEYAKDNGYDSVIFKNLKDNGGRNSNVPRDTIANVYVVFNPNNVKSADPITYDDNGNVIPLSDRFKNEKVDIRYSKDDTIVDYSDLTTLDDEEIKVYNKRGWANQLFTNEDRKLLEGEFAKLKPVKTQRTDNVLGDGSRIVEVNNKIVLIGGTFAEPEIYCVLAINAANETEATDLKEVVFYEYKNYRRNKEALQSLFQYVQSCEEDVRTYRAEDFYYTKGQKDYGERAVLPSSFKNYGYTEQFQDGTGNNRKAGRDVSEIKLAVDDTITDGMFADGDLFDEDGYIQQSVFEKAVKDNPDFALTAVYNHAAKTAESAIKQSSDVKLDDKAYLLAAHRLMARYDISRKLNKGFDEELAQTIRKHIERMEKGVTDFAGELELLADDCKYALMLSGKLDGEALKTEREEILGYLRGKTLILSEYAESDVRGDYDTLQNYRKRMFGKINVAYEKNLKNNSKGLFSDSGNNIYINDVIAFVEERFPHLITDDADDISGYRWLDNLVNGVLKPKFVNNYIDGFYENIDTAAIEMAFDVTTEVINEKAKLAVSIPNSEHKLIKEIAAANKKAEAEQKALLKAKAESYRNKAKEERSKRIKMIENLRRRMSEITHKSDKQRLKYEAQIDKLKTSLDKKTIILNIGYETIREQYNENRTKTVYREKLGRMLDRMTKKLDGKANNNEYIPEVLKKPILDVLSSFTADPGTYKNGKKKTLPGYYGEWKNIAKIGDRVNELTNAYESLKSKNDSKEKKYAFIDVNSIAFREGTLEVLKYLSENLNGKNIYDLSADDLIDIYEAMQELDNSLRSAVEIILDGQKMSVQEAANRAIAETESVKYKKDVQRFSNTAVNVAAGSFRTLKNKFLATQLDPKRFGRVLTGYHDDYVISQVMSELHEGDKKHTRIMQECFVRVQSVTSKYSKSEVKGLQRDDVTKFNFKEQKTGKRVKVSQGMLLAIYLTDRQADGHRHLVNENYNHYTVIPDLDMMNLGRDGMNKSHRVRFSEADLRAIKQYVENNKMLSELAGAISEVYNTVLNQYINEVSMAKYGKLIATVNNYYPLWVYSDGAHYEKNFEAEFNDIRMKSRSFTKQRTRSYDPIVINDALKTFTKSVQSASEYCGLLIPIENFKRVYNSGNGDVTLHEAIKEKFGESAEHYIEKLMADLQNAPEILDNTWLQKAQGNFMGAKLLLNPGAAIKQLAAFPTAFNYFGVKNVTAAAAVGIAKIDFDLYAKYTPYLWYRKNGNGTVIGELSREMGFYRKWNERADIMGKMDRYVVGSLLYAAELHVEQTTDLKRGTDAFYKEVVRQFEKCVDETQPNNMITSKPQFIRNNVMKLLSLNAFKSQNMAIANCVIDSYGEFAARKAEYKESKTDEARAAKNEAAKKFAGSVIGAVCSSALIGILTVAVNLFLWHKWDDFKDEEGNVTPLTILLNFIDYSLESFAGCCAWADKAYDAISAKIKGEKYWGFEVMSIENLNDSVEKLTKGDFVGFATIIVDCLGFPLENLLRIARSISSYANDISNGYGEIITKNNSTENNTSYFNFIIVEAKQKGETEKAEHFEQLWKDDLINKQGKTEEQANDTIKTKIVTALAVSDDDVEQAALSKANGDLSSYEEHMNKVVGYGFDSVDVKKAVDKVIKNVVDDVKNRGLEEKSDIISDLKNQGFNDKGAEYVYNSMQNGESPESEGELSVFSDTSEGEGVAYTYSDAFEYLKNGDRENYERIEQYLIDNAGKTKKDVRSAMRSASRTDELWKEYFEAQGTLSGGGDSVKLEEYKKILTNIYGSWSTAVTYGRKYQKRMQKKEREKNK
ncbi:hypothetical protein [uncultured Ruminococcus sp.]|uniref:PBECR3 domain-containing polyvalent protein n=1 Tax=uncultured Ruminococcus sp. TaxID=165186 RepID=UPI0025D88DF1|nr:hypothetical protein [uncultured Ruminococcus sp.]